MQSLSGPLPVAVLGPPESSQIYAVRHDAEPARNVTCAPLCGFTFADTDEKGGPPCCQPLPAHRQRCHAGRHCQPRPTVRLEHRRESPPDREAARQARFGRVQMHDVGADFVARSDSALGLRPRCWGLDSGWPAR